MPLNKVTDIIYDQVEIDHRAALDELKRELSVRLRIYDRWVSEGRLSWTEAQDRYKRHLMAVKIVDRLCAFNEGQAEQQAEATEAEDYQAGQVASA